MDGGLFLKIGDLVTLKHAKPQEGWLSSEGMLSDGVSLSKDVRNFENCIWEVHVQNQYTAVKEYEEALFAELLAEGNRDNVSFRSAVSQLFSSDHLGKAAANEERMNEKLMALKVGKPVTYGDVIQLRHVKSKKFLTVSPSLALAKEERENLRISLERYGDSTSWLELIPLSTTDADGQQIANDTDVLLAVHERPMEFIHCAGRPNASGTSHEINCSLTSSSWSISIFQHAVTPFTAVAALNVIALHAPDSSAYLTVSTAGPEPCIQFTDTPHLLSTLAVSTEFRVGTPALWMVEKEKVYEGGCILASSLTQAGTGVKLRHLNTGLYIYVAETGQVGLVDGQENCSTFEVSLPHHKGTDERQVVQSGAHVAVSSGNHWLCRSAERPGNPRMSIAFATAKDSVVPQCSSTNEKAHATPFVITTGLYHSIQEDLYLGIASVNYLKEFQSAIRLFRQSDGNMSKLNKYVSSLLDVLNSIHESISRDTAPKSMDLDSLAKSATVANDELQVRRMLRQMMLQEQGVLDVILDIIELCNQGYFANIPYDMVGLGDKKLGQMGSLKNPALAAQKRRTSIKIMPRDASSSALTSKEREMIRKSLIEDGTKDLLARRKVAKVAAKIEEEEDDDDDDDDDEEGDCLPEMNVVTKSNPRVDIKPKVDVLTLEVSRLCFRILLLAIKDSQVNQIHIADRFPVILSQLQVHDLAVQCIHEMLRDNLQMLNTKINEQVIEKFVGMLEESPMNIIFLKLLQNTCSCPMGVDSTQCMVATQLFGELESPSHQDTRVRSASDVLRFTETVFEDHKTDEQTNRSLDDVPAAAPKESVLIHASLEFGDALKNKPLWVRGANYIPIGDDNSCKKVLGMTLLSHGMPEIHLSWKCANKYSMITLYGTSNSIPYDIFVSAAWVDEVDVKSKPTLDFLKRTRRTSRKSRYDLHSLSSGELGSASSRVRAKTKLTRRGTNGNGNDDVNELRKQAIEYFSSLLYLMADLCLDRNYLSIKQVESIYPYELLVAILVHERSPPIIKAPACRMLRCVFVDRSPHVAVKFPRLIRFGQLAVGEREEAPTVKFALVQHVIYDYIHSCLNIDRKCDEVSVEMIELLLSLTTFDFYTLDSLLHDIVPPLTEQLSRRRHTAVAISAGDSHVGTWKSALRGSPKISPIANNEAIERSEPSGDNESQSGITRVASKHSSGSEKGTADDNKVKWEETVLRTTESFLYNIYMLALVIVSVVIVIFTLLPGREGPATEVAVLAVDRLVTVLFMVDLVMRMYTNYRVNREFASFFTELHKVIDVVVIVIDIMIISLSSAHVFERAQAFSRLLRILRILRLARIYRVVKMLMNISRAVDESYEYVMPERYKNIDKLTARTVAGVMRVLSTTHDYMQDRKIDALVGEFSEWFDKRTKGVALSPDDVYREVQLANPVVENFSGDLVDTLLDFMMYEDDTVMLEALRLLMSHINHEHQFLRVAYKTHVITSPQLRFLALATVKDVQTIGNMADSYEIWRELRTDKDIKCAQDVIDTLDNIATKARSGHSQMDQLDETARGLFTELQTIMFNIEAFAAFVKLQKVMLESDSPPFNHRVEQIIIKCNEAIIMFVYENERNQRVAFREFTWFLDKTDYGLRFAKVVRAILSGNNRLIKQCPMSWVSFCINHIISNGKKPEYLDVLIGMTDMDEIQGVNLLSKEVARYLTSRDIGPRIMEWCVGENHNEYTDRVDAMAPYLSDEIAYRDEDLSPALQYHINLLVLLRNCGLGQRLEALYGLDDVVAAILDHDTLINVRIALGQILLELNIIVPGCECSEAMWSFFNYVADYVTQFSYEYANKERPGTKGFLSSECRWLSLCFEICCIFFESFDINLYAEYMQQKTAFRTTSRSAEEMEVEMEKVGMSMDKLRRATRNRPLPDMELNLLLNNLIALIGVDDSNRPTAVMKRELSMDRISNMSTMRHCLARAVSTGSDLAYESYYRQEFNSFLDVLALSRGRVSKRTMEIFDMLPSVNKAVNVDIRLEPIVTRIVVIIRSRIRRTAVSKFGLDLMLTDIAKWLLETWTNIITTELGLSLHELADFEHCKNISESTHFQKVLNQCGVTSLCLDLIAMGIDTELCMIALKLLVVLLAKDDGHTEVQESVFDFLKNTDSVLFFEKVRDIIEKSTEWYSADTNAEGESLMKHRNEFYVFTLIQFMCAGNFIKNQDLLRDQPGNSRVVNVLLYLTQCVKSLSKLDSHDVMTAVVPVLVAAISTVRGDLVTENKEYYALHSSILPIFKHMIRHMVPNTSQNMAMHVKDSELMKELVIDMMQAMVEGLSHDNVVIDRIKIVMELKILHVFLMPTEFDEYGDLVELNKLSSLQAKYIVLLKTVGTSEMPPNLKPSVHDDIATLEVLWHGRPHTYYCYLPKVSDGLLQDNSRRFMEDVRIDSQEILLKDFMKIAADLRRVTLHHNTLETFGFANISGVNKSLSWIMLSNVVIINFLLVMFYRDNHDNGKHLSDDVDHVVFVLSVVQVIMACGSLAIIFAAHVPVLHGSYADAGQNSALALIKSLGDIELVWKIMYLGFSILAIWQNYLFLSVLLLEFVVMNSTCRDIVKAVFFPAKQLLATVFIIGIVLNVFGGVLYTFYRDDVSLDLEINTLFQSIKYATTYGVRSSGAGLGAYMEPSVNNRFTMDMVFFIVFNAILMEVFFGVIIDTFGEIRDLKAQRENHFANKCYICGVDARAFVKQGPLAFSTHVSSKHNMWNYLYFVMRLWQQPRHKDDSVEMYIRKLIESGDDISWFPIGVVGE